METGKKSGTDRTAREEAAMERLFDEELKNLKEKLLRMAGLVEESIELAIEALKEQRDEPARAVLKNEEQINLLDVEVDETCLRLMALRQPMAGDLRFITSAMKIDSELERMGDLAVNISEQAFILNKLPQLKPLLDIPRMARISQAMVRDSINAFINRDEALARSVCERDDEVDALDEQIFRELLTYMMEDPATISRAVALILVSRNLERMADHATNIGEDVIYLAKGKSIKHHIDRKRESDSSVRPIEPPQIIQKKACTGVINRYNRRQVFLCRLEKTSSYLMNIIFPFSAVNNSRLSSPR